MRFHSLLRLGDKIRTRRNIQLAALPLAPRGTWQARLEMLEDRALLTAAGVAATYSVTNDWGSGFQARSN